MNIDISKFAKPYIPPKKSEYERKIEIRYWKRKIEESLQNLKRLEEKND